MVKEFTSAILLPMVMAIVLVSPFTSASAAVDGMPSFSARDDSGVYVWRTSRGVWNLRVVAGQEFREFDGVLESGQAFGQVKAISLEGNDIADENEPGKLSTHFRVRKSGVDGISFVASAGAGICLRGAPGSEITVYLGRDAEPASTPVDLTGSGACDTSFQKQALQEIASPEPVATEPVIPESAPQVVPAASVSPEAVVVQRKKYHPGHYLALYGFEKQSAMYAGARPGIRGIQKRYTWRSLESSPGQYDFSKIDSDLAVAASQGLQLIVMIEDKSFRNDPKPTPEYLQGEQYTRPTRSGGYTAVRYDPYVVKRMKALLKALGENFDAHPNLEGVAIQESAIGFVKSTLNATGYTPERYRDALIEVLLSAASSFPNSQVLWYMNFLAGNQSYIGQVASAVAPAGVIMGGPDILPDDYAIKTRAFPFYDEFNGKMRLFCSAQNNSYRHPHKDTAYPTEFWTPEELFLFARDQLHANYVFWNHNTWLAGPAGSYRWKDAVPVIEANPVFNP